MVILGGMGNTIGVIIAAVLLTLLPEGFCGPFAEYRMIIYSLLLIVLMLTRPQGLFSLSKRPRKIKMSALLQLDKATIRFGGLTAVSELDLQIGRNELVGLIGPNGAGKTTAFNLITGVYQPTAGAISFDGKSIVGKQAVSHHARGIARTFQNIRLFAIADGFRQCPHRRFSPALRGDGVRHALWRGRGFGTRKRKSPRR
jgi:ABC-type bacteriocin/lantibiotic exporter with double-glycine peptidase domain